MAFSRALTSRIVGRTILCGSPAAHFQAGCRFASNGFQLLCISLKPFLLDGKSFADPGSSQRRSYSGATPATSGQYETIRVETEDGVSVITLSRPKALNALNSQAMRDILAATRAADADPAVKVIIITGEGSKAFAAGADIKEMAGQPYAQAYGNLLGDWTGIQNIRKPLIAAVNGAALGGGCELAMMCDIIIAADNATLGQPELNLGVIPGMGGTQRLVRAVGKSKAMEMILTASRIGANEAKELGLVSRVVAAEQLLHEAKQVAAKIASLSAPAVAKAKDCINRSYEMSLSEGLRYELREFWSCFALADQKEGMAAFVEKRKPEFKGE